MSFWPVSCTSSPSWCHWENWMVSPLGLPSLLLQKSAWNLLPVPQALLWLFHLSCHPHGCRFIQHTLGSQSLPPPGSLPWFLSIRQSAWQFNSSVSLWWYLPPSSCVIFMWLQEVPYDMAASDVSHTGSFSSPKVLTTIQMCVCPGSRTKYTFLCLYSIVADLLPPTWNRG